MGDKSKSGFGAPVGDWLRTSLKSELISYTDRRFLNDQGIFNVDSIIKLIEDHLSGKRDSTFKAWTYYCFQKWYKTIHLEKAYSAEIHNII